MKPKIVIGIIIALIICLSIFGVKSCIHHQQMIDSVKEWSFVGNYYEAEQYYTTFMMIPSGNSYITIPQTNYIPPRYYSVWSGVDIEGNTQQIEREWYGTK